MLLVGIASLVAWGCPGGGAQDEAESEERRASLVGCWRIDVPAMRETNDIPQDIVPERFEDWMKGYRLVVSEDEVRQYLQIDGERVFDDARPAAIERHAGGIAQLSTRGKPASTKVGIPPPARLASPVSFELAGPERVVAEENFVLEAAWGVDTGPLPLLLDTACAPQPGDRDRT